jgi:hypothetical protein
MKRKKVFGSLGAVLILSLLVTSFATLGVIHDSDALREHDCTWSTLETTILPDGTKQTIVRVHGWIEFHVLPGHHPFTCV